MLRDSILRQVGWVLAVFGIGVVAVLLPAFAWASRRDIDAFNAYVGWASILALPVAGLGVVMVMAEKLGAVGNLSPTRMARIVDELARQVIRQDSLLLAQLLSTDALDSRAARGNFRYKKAHSQQKSKRQGSGIVVREFADIVDYYLNETRRRLIILGAPGAGKTVLAVSLSVGLVKRRTGDSSAENRHILVPCLFNLSSWDPASHSLTDWLEVQIINRFRVGKKVATRLVWDRWVIPVLDGLDEMDSPEVEPRRAISAIAGINDYIACTPDSHIVVVCRSGESYYGRLARKVRDAEEITVENLKPAQIIDYVQTQCSDEFGLKAWRPVFDALRGNNSSLVLSELGTLWHLSAAVTFFRSGGDPVQLLPNSDETVGKIRRDAYSKRVDKLLMEAFLAARISIYSKRGDSVSLTIRRLRTVAYLLTKKQSFQNGSQEIILHQWWKVFDHRNKRGVQTILAAHTFVAWLFLHFPAAVMGFFESTPAAGHKGGLFMYAMVLVNYFTIIFIGARRVVARNGPIALRIGSLRSPRRVIITAIGIFVATLIGLFMWFAQGVFYGVGYGVIIATLVTLITASSGLDPTSATHPTAILVNDRNFSAVIGVAIGAYATLYYTSLFGISLALTFASMCVIGSIFSSSYMRYLVAVYFGSRHGLPLRFARFLGWCHAAGLLRITGIGYQFRHQGLLDYLKG